MDFADLGSARTLLKWQEEYCRTNGVTFGGLPAPIVRGLTRQTAVGLHTLQKQRVIHRDMKPDNVLLNFRGEACIADFGISIVLQGQNSGPVEIGEGVNLEGHSGVIVDTINLDGTFNLKDRRSQTIRNVKRESFSPKKLFRAHSFVGTQAYISPQMAKNSGVSLKEDIWAFGIMLYEWTVGQHPFQDQLNSTGELFGSLWELMQEKEGITLPTPAEAGGREFDPLLHDLVAKCLKKRPSERPSISEIMKHAFIADVDMTAYKKAWNAWLNEIGKAPTTTLQETIKVDRISPGGDKEKAVAIKRIFQGYCLNGRTLSKDDFLRLFSLLGLDDNIIDRLLVTFDNGDGRVDCEKLVDWAMLTPL